MNTNKPNLKLICSTALMAALMCVLSPLSIPLGPVPVSLATFALFFSVYILGAKAATISVIIYLLIGLCGVPVFSGFGAGLAKLMGPTGGYLLGYIPAAIISGILIEKFAQKKAASIFSMLLATSVLYFIGTAWLSKSLNLTFTQALMMGVIPFIPGDIVKVFLSVFAGAEVLKRIPALSRL